MRADRRRLRRALGAAEAVERPLAELRRRADTYTPDQRTRLARFVLADLEHDVRLEVVARHLIPTLPDPLRHRCDHDPATAAAIVGRMAEHLESFHRRFPLRLRALRHDLP